LLSPDSRSAFSLPLENDRLISKKVKIDSKGRISISSEIRKNFGLEEGSEIGLVFDPKRNFVVLVFDNGQDSVVGSTEVCGTSDPGSKEFDAGKNLRRSVAPGPGPRKRWYE
jgi:AbrB family looped-hinge helix DNA binding protein